MPTIRSWTIFATLVVIAVSGACSLQDPLQQLKNDKEATEAISSLERQLKGGTGVSPETFAKLKALREKYPDNPIVKKYYKKALIVRKDWEPLEKLLLENGKEDLSPEDSRTLAKVYVESGRFSDAVEILSPLIEKSPSDAELRGLAGLSYLRMGELDKAAENFDAVWDQIIERKMAAEISLRGIVYFRQNKLEKARETLGLAASIDPGNITTNNALSQVYRALGNEEKAREYAKKAYDAQEEATARELAASRIVERKVLLEQAWKSGDFRRVIELSNLLLPDSRNPAEKQVLLQYLYNAYKKLGMEKEAGEILGRSRAENR